MASDLCILDKVGCKETGIGASHLCDGIDSAVARQKVGAAEELGAGYWRQMGGKFG